VCKAKTNEFPRTVLSKRMRGRAWGKIVEEPNDKPRKMRLRSDSQISAVKCEEEKVNILKTNRIEEMGDVASPIIKNPRAQKYSLVIYVEKSSATPSLNPIVDLRRDQRLAKRFVRPPAAQSRDKPLRPLIDLEKRVTTPRCLRSSHVHDMRGASQTEEKKLDEGQMMRLRGVLNENDTILAEGAVVFNYTFPNPDGGSKKEAQIQLTKYDMKRLKRGTYINDAIIFFYLKVIQNEMMPADDRNRIHIFDTYFIVKFRDIAKKGEKMANSYREAYNEVKKWTKNVDILDKDFLIFPIHELEHWSLIIVCYPWKWYTGDEVFIIEDHHEEWKLPCIIAFDSLEPLESGYRDLIQT
jgi:hypothetical protein